MEWDRGQYPVGFKVQTNSEQIGVMLEKNSNNHDILAQLAAIYKGGKEIRLLWDEKKNVTILKEGSMLLQG